MPPAARITDMHACPMVTVLVPHVGGPIAMGSPNVITGSMPQARVGDMLVCVGPPDVIAKGSSGVFVNNMPAARMGDLTAHGGAIVLGFPTVLIGEVGGGQVGQGEAFGSGQGGGTAPVGSGTVAMSFTDPQQQAQTLKEASASGAPFCEACFKAQQEELRRQQQQSGSGVA